MEIHCYSFGFSTHFFLLILLLFCVRNILGYLNVKDLASRTAPPAFFCLCVLGPVVLLGQEKVLIA